MYELILEQVFGPSDAPEKAVGDNVYLRDLSDEPRVFALFYPSAMRAAALVDGLVALGELAGSNLFVNIGRLNDPDFAKITRAFELQRFPAIVVTAAADLAAAPDREVTAFVRLDEPRLLADPERCVQLVQELFTMFISGQVAEAMSKAKWAQRAEGVRAVYGSVLAALKRVVDFVSDHEIEVSVLGGSFRLTPRGE
jgi:hypothetical protein